MRNKGYTLIEVIFTITLATLLYSMVFVNYSKISSITNDLDCKYYENAVKNLLLKSKYYCRLNEITGQILFESQGRNIYFRDLSQAGKPKVVYLITFPSEYEINYVSFKNNQIFISSNGTVRGDAGKIEFKDKRGKIHIITMRVGSSYVDIK